MKNKILIGVLTTSLLVTSGGYAMTYEETKDLKDTIEEQKVDSKKKSTEIANLEKTIENMDIDLNAKNMVIEGKNAEINDLTVENKKLVEENNKLKSENQNLKKNKVSKRSDVQGASEKSIKTMTVNASAYIAFCSEGCTGRTRSGYDVSSTIYYNGMRIIASDTSVLPMYSIVKLEGFSEKFIVLDTGGGIKGNKIDILFNSQSEAVKFGRRNIKLEVIRYGK